MRIAVTGASGFCGGAVATLAAARGEDVVCLGRKPAPGGVHIPWNATGLPPDLAGVDVLVHCASAVADVVPGSRSEGYLRAVNVHGAGRLLEAAAHIPVVWLSTASVYDPFLDRRRVRENHPVRRQLNAYARTKAAGERLALAAGAVVLRPRAVYGPGDSQLLPRLIRKVRAGVLPVPGPDVRFSLTAVENLADACLQAARWPPGAYNIADSHPYSRDDTLRRALRAAGVHARLCHVPVVLASAAAVVGEAVSRAGPRAGLEPVLSRYAVDQLAHSVILDISKARRQGWHPRRSLSDFLQESLSKLPSRHKFASRRGNWAKSINARLGAGIAVTAMPASAADSQGPGKSGSRPPGNRQAASGYAACLPAGNEPVGPMLPGLSIINVRRTLRYALVPASRFHRHGSADMQLPQPER